MAYRVLEVTLQSAKDLKNVNFMSRMEVYAVATISGDPITRQCTSPDPYGGRHPTWNTTLRFAVPPTAGAGASGCLHVVLRTERFRGDRDIGEVIVPLDEILAGAGYDFGPRPPQYMAYKIRKVHRSETRGVLYLSYRLGSVVVPQAPHRWATRAPSDEPIVAYPATRPYGTQPYDYMPVPALMPPPPTPQASGGHVALPPSPQDAGQMDLPPQLPKAYAHLSMPPPPAPIKTSGHKTHQKSAGYAANSPWTPGKSNGNPEFGMGLSAGLDGGSSGGMMAGDMMSDGAAYNAGYRAAMAREWRGGVY